MSTTHAVQTIDQPSVFELIARAIVDTDFMGEIPNGTSDRDLRRAATIAAEQASEAWEYESGHDEGTVVAADIREAVTAALVKHGEMVLRRAQDAADTAIENAIYDGDVSFARGC